MQLLYTANYFKPHLADEAFLPEAKAFAQRKFRVSTINVDELISNQNRAKPPLEGPTLYRGWMLDEREYGLLSEAIRRSGGVPITSREQYLLTHHIPNWVPLLVELTPETIVLPNGSDFESELRLLGWDAFFVKDYVKSLKVSIGSQITDPSQIGALVEKMENFRGTIEGGLCIRRVEKLRPETETRYFVLEGRPYSPDGTKPPAIVFECAERIASPFFSVDVALNESGERRIVELGDGQVSDLVGWNISQFVRIFRDGG